METTVLTTGGPFRSAGAVAVVHALTWVTAALMIGVWGNEEMEKVTDSKGETKASDAAKMLGMVYSLFIVAILVMVLIHASCARKEEEFGSVIMSVCLLTMVAFENCLGCAYVGYSLVLGSSEFYTAAVVSQLFVCLGSAMIVAFYVNWSHRGDVEPIFGSGSA